MAPFISHLFVDADALAPLDAVYDLSTAERGRLMRSKTEYQDFYGRLKDRPLAVSCETGRLLCMLGRGCRLRTVVEFGTSFGLSTLHLAAALRDNGGGRLITSEFEPSKVARAMVNLTAGGLIDLVEFRECDALTTLAFDMPESVDLLLLDGARALYPEILDQVESRQRPGAFVAADNAADGPDSLARVRDPARGYLSLPFGEDVELSIRLA